MNVALCRTLSHPSPLSSAAVFLRAADLISTEYRYRLLATTMIGQVRQKKERTASRSMILFAFSEQIGVSGGN